MGGGSSTASELQRLEDSVRDLRFMFEEPPFKLHGSDMTSSSSSGGRPSFRLLGSATAFSRSFVWLSPSTPFGSAMTTSSSNNGGRPLSGDDEEFSLRLLGSRSFEPLPPNMDEMRKMRERKQQQKDFIVTHLGSRSYEPLPLNMDEMRKMRERKQQQKDFIVTHLGSRSYEPLPLNSKSK
ncbi:hypothetical protein D5F01_LYC09921 [Larimichthys crocea]|uniref:Uncharacterized protein n=1 Tax=Larimichthys crocea TaxID=215358 RepID=A0A6G0IMP5_LARCR|nr:hypothetical protein D5F01_LYC09921 [Larimichthys crocea]